MMAEKLGKTGDNTSESDFLRHWLPGSGLSQGLRHQLVIVLAAGLICFTNLGATALWDLDEALFSSIAREMHLRGDWVVPTFNGEVFYDKPPLMFWLMMGSFKLLGQSEFAARLPAAILAIGTALVTYHLGRRLFSAEVGFWAGLAATSNIIFTVSARAATVDAALMFLTTLAMTLFARGAKIGETERAGPAEGSGQLAFLPASWSVFAAIGILLGLAMLAKGPVGFLLPAAALGLFLLLMNEPSESTISPASKLSGGRFQSVLAGVMRVIAIFSPRKVFRVFRAMRPLMVLAFTALVALPWYAAVAWQTHGEWLAQFVTKYNLGPFVKPFLGHSGPVYYHLLVVLIGLFPWSVFLGPTVACVWRSIRAGSKDLPSYVFLVSWVGVFFGFWSACSTKLPHYVLPAYPALAILTGCFLHAWIERADATARHVMPIATSIFLVVGVGMLAVLPWVTARYAPGDGIVALVGLVLTIGGGLSWHFLARDRRRSYAAVFAASSVLFITMLFGWAAMHIDRHQHSRPLMAEIRRDSPAEPQIAGFKYCDASTVYYAGGPVTECNNAARLREFLACSPHPYVVTTSDELAKLQGEAPGGWRVVARRPRFLASGEIVVLAPLAAEGATTRRLSDAVTR